MTALATALVSATLLVSLVAGFLFAFAVVVMPGIRDLDDGEFVRAFQRMDGVIQRGSPLFGLVFVGSGVALLVSTVLGAQSLAAPDRLVLFAAGALYLVGVFVPTGVVNVPLNNQLQRLDVRALDARQRSAARRAFELRWNRWNRLRTVVAVVAATLMTSLLLTL